MFVNTAQSLFFPSENEQNFNFFFNLLEFKN